MYVSSNFGSFGLPNSLRSSSFSSDSIGDTLFNLLACSLSSLSKFLISPKPVLRLITTFSLIGSIGGFVTCANFCLKKSLKFLWCLLNAASGVSSPIDAVASLPSLTIGSNTCSITSRVMLKYLCLASSSSFCGKFTLENGLSIYSWRYTIFSLSQASCGFIFLRYSLISSFLSTFPYFKSTPIISPDCNLPRSSTSSSGVSSTPYSDEISNLLSFVMIYFDGLSPFLSSVHPMYLPSVILTAAGPSQGSKHVLAYS